MVHALPICHADHLAALEHEWRDLYDRNDSASIFASFDYLSLWYRSFAHPQDVRVYRVTENGRLVGFLPLVLRRHGPVRLLSSLTNDHSMHPATLVSREHAESFARCWLESLRSDRWGWDILHKWSYSFDPDYEVTVPTWPRCGGKRIAKPTYSVAIKGGFEEYVGGLSIKMRRTTKREWNKLARIPTARFCHHTGEEALALWPEFLLIEDSGWKGRRASSIRRLPAHLRGYYDGLVRLLASSGQLYLHFLEIDGVKAAGAFSYLDGEVFHMAKAGYREDYAAVSPSNLLMLHVIEDVMGRLPAVRRINLFPGDFGYKHRYVNEQTTFSEFTAYNRTILGLAALCRSRLKALLSERGKAEISDSRPE